MSAVVAAIVAAGCGGPPPIAEPSFPLECIVGPHVASSEDSVTAVFLGTGSVHDDRLLSFSVSATPIYVDCGGVVRPGFVDRWMSHDRGRRWSLAIRPDLVFVWGEKLSEIELARRWNSSIPVLDAGVDSVVVTGSREVDVYFRRAFSNIPQVLADNAFGLRLRKWPAVGLLSTAGRDPRDLLEAPLDIMITLDSDVVDYARRQAHLDVFELPWDRVYVLLCRSRVDAMVNGEDVPWIGDPARVALAADAVRASARASGASFWWDDVDDCPKPSDIVPWMAPPGPGGLGDGPLQIVYEQGDPIARGLAERIVALASLPPNADGLDFAAAVPGLVAGVKAVGVGRMSLDADLAYIVALPLVVPDACLERLRLVERVHWLLSAEDDLSRAIIPLVEAHPYAIIRNGAASLSVDMFGNVRVAR